MSSSPNHEGAAAPTTEKLESQSSDGSAPQSPPPPPNPSTDPRLIIPCPAPNLQPITSPELNAQPDNIFEVSPIAALKLLTAGVEALVRITGDIPPTPPPTTPHIPNMRGMQAEKESIVRNYSEKSLARMREMARQTQDAGNTPGPPATIPDDLRTPSPSSSNQNSPSLVIPKPRRAANLDVPGAQHPTPPPIDGVRLKPTPSPEPGTSLVPPPPSSTPEPYVIIGANSQPLNLQHSAITRKFYSKKPPPIGISDYLLRIHRFCPMSTAVYLATSLYIHRLAVNERAVAVTKRNAHRLLLAGLRVAMKVLEDLSYPHSKVAKVGGVSELELARLEISFCFLCGFELVVGATVLQDHWMTMKNGPDLSAIGNSGAVLPSLTMPNLRMPPPPRSSGEGLGHRSRFSH